MRGKQSARCQRVARPCKSNTSAGSARRLYDKRLLVRVGSVDSRSAYPVGARAAGNNLRQRFQKPFQFYFLAVTESHQSAGPPRFGVWERASPCILMPEPRANFASCVTDLAPVEGTL